MFPRRDGVMLGGAFEHGKRGLAPEPAATARVLAGHKAQFSRMRV